MGVGGAHRTAARHATHVSTASGQPAVDPAGTQLTARQLRRIEGLAHATGAPLPSLRGMTHKDAEQWIERAEAQHRRVSLQGRDEL